MPKYRIKFQLYDTKQPLGIANIFTDIIITSNLSFQFHIPRQIWEEIDQLPPENDRFSGKLSLCEMDLKDRIASQWERINTYVYARRDLVRFKIEHEEEEEEEDEEEEEEEDEEEDEYSASDTEPSEAEEE
ncbi:hypothetical protein SNEBB_007667 [Seison nebaliae]|nr:hypothetical protein SNEBB_007667 [Seison nebaliae]